MTETPSEPQTAHTLTDANLDAPAVNRVESRVRSLPGVAYVTRPTDSAVLYVGLQNAICFEDDDAPNPLDPDNDAETYDVDGIRKSLLDLTYELGIECIPHKLYQNRTTDVMEYAVPLADSHTDLPSFIPTPADAGNIANGVRAASRDRANAYLRVLSRRRDVTVEDMPELVTMVDETVPHMIPSRARDRICDFFGFNDDEIVYGDLRDAPIDVQKQYWQNMAEIASLHRESADLIDEYDSDIAADHRQTALVEYDANLQGVPSEWFDNE